MSADKNQRFENAELAFNGFDGESGFDLLRECVKSVLDERNGKKKKPPPKLKTKSMPRPQ